MVRRGKKSELGRALARRRQRDQDAAQSASLQAGSIRHTATHDDRGKLQSVLDATDLEEFMLNAEMANEGFETERGPRPLAPPRVVATPLLANTVSSHLDVQKRKQLNRTALRIPRRPFWDSSTTPMELLKKETDEFLKWRRNIATLEEQHRLSAVNGPMMTPFEKNIEVWRQLWRVVERSDVIVQIVDARNPLLYYCEDMFRYVTREMGRSHLLVLNKSDLLSEQMISRWESYFKSHSMDALFFSAFKASVNEVVQDSRVVGVGALIEKLQSFDHRAPVTQPNQRLVVGMCGYPNVGKSSTINVLLEEVAATGKGKHQWRPTHDGAVSLQNRAVSECVTTDNKELSSVRRQDDENAPAGGTLRRQLKRVAVSSTPGKTKHFQTLVLTDTLLLCDCPGLVFPNFSSSKAELICAGVLSIDQMRGDHLSPVSLIANRIPAAIFEGVYGLRFPSVVDGVCSDADVLLRARPGYVSATMLLDTHARARGFMSGHDKPDQSRSSRVLLKDYVNGRIIFCHAPPPREIEDGESGVGPAVYAKKGALVYQRQETTRVTGKPVSAAKSSESWNGSSSSALEAIEDDDDSSLDQVRAMVRRSKKHEDKQFVRVQRSYYRQGYPAF